VEAPILELSNVSYSAAATTILPSVSHSFSTGKIYGLVGPNGSGKSTLLKLIARQLAPDAGTIRLDGRGIGDLKPREFARAIAYMPQFTPATEGMTTRELVALGRFPWHGSLGRFTPEDTALVDDAILRTNLSPLASRNVASLSGGERQRAWIAMMLAQNARCLLLDEPTSALDLSHQSAIVSMVRELAREKGLTVVLVLHDINLTARYCDEIIALNHGRIVASGPPGEIMQAKALKSVFGVDMGVFAHPLSGHPVSYLL
jgi:iron-chelate-transporting ATPase